MNIKPHNRGYVLLSIVAIIMVISAMGLTLVEKAYHYEKIIQAVNASLNLNMASRDASAYLLHHMSFENSTDYHYSADYHFVPNITANHPQSWPRITLPNRPLGPKASITYQRDPIGLFLVTHGKNLGCNMAIIRYFVRIKAHEQAPPVIWQAVISRLQKNLPLSKNQPCDNKRILSIHKL